MLFLPLRFALTGRNVGIGIPSTIELLGKDECIDRLNTLVRYELIDNDTMDLM